jgi:hypothetical protein
MMRVRRQGAALSGLEIHHVISGGAAMKRQRRVLRFFQEREVDPEAFVGGLGSADRLEDQIDRRASANQIKRRRHMRQNAALGRDIEFHSYLFEHRQQRAGALRAVGRRIDSDDGVT